MNVSEHAGSAQTHRWQGTDRTTAKGFILKKQTSLRQTDDATPSVGTNRKFLDKYKLSSQNLFAPS